MIKHVRTPDDWFPTRHDGTVKVKLIRLQPGADLAWRVWVSGSDDFALHKDFPAEQEPAARALWGEITDGVSIAALKNLGFVQF